MNKILVSIVFAIILILGINKITDAIFYVEKPEKSAYQVAVVNTTSSTTTTTNTGTSESGNIMALFASVSSADGAKVFKKCAACHSITKGGGNKLDQLYGMFSEEKQVLFRITSIQKQW